MAKEVTCPACGNRGEATIDDTGAFEVRGQFQGKAVRRCKKCGTGFLFGLFFGIIFGKPKAIPSDLLKHMERKIMQENIVVLIFLNSVVRLISLAILLKGLDKYNVITSVQYNYIVWIFILWDVIFFSAWIYGDADELIYGQFEKFKLSSLLIPLILNIFITASMSCFIFLKLPNLKYIILPIIWAFFILPAWLLFLYYQNKKWITYQKKLKRDF